MSLVANAAARPKPTRRWYQFSLRGLLIFMTFAGCGLGWLGIRVQRAVRQHETAAFIKQGGGSVEYSYQLDSADDAIPKTVPPGPAWARDLVGVDLFDDVVKIQIGDEAQAACIKNLPGLRSVQFQCSFRLTDAAVAHLPDAPQLRAVWFGMADKVTDAGLVPLRALKRLKKLSMEYLRITDAGLEHLQSLNELEELTLGPGITDSGSKHLTGLSHLKILNLTSTHMTAAGVRQLQTALPDCQIEH